MLTTIQIGGIDPNDPFRTPLTMPILRDFDALSLMSDALDQAVHERKGVVIVGPKGVGKTVALRQAIDRRMEAEWARKDLDAGYLPRQVVLLRSIRARRYRDVLGALYNEVLGTEWADRWHGRTKSDDTLRAELIMHLADERRVLIAVDEAETLTPDAVAALRDLIAEAEDRDADRFSSDGITAAGVGVLLVGTGDGFAARIAASDEAGHRWVRVVRLDPLEPAQVPALYPRLLPGLRTHIDAVGAAAWATYVDATVVRGRRLPIRALENHVRAYFRLLASNDHAVTSLDTAYFHGEMFELTWSDVDWCGAL